jgi:regulator of replication initiation timing
MRKARSHDKAESLVSEDSDLASQLSNLRSEVFDQDYVKKPTKNYQQKHLPHAQRPQTPNKLSMDDISTPMIPRSRYHPPPETESFFNQTIRSRAVIETEQMGLRLSEEIQRLRHELKRVRESNSELSSENRKLSSELESLKFKLLEETQSLQQITSNHQRLVQDCERYKLELVSSFLSFSPLFFSFLRSLLSLTYSLTHSVSLLLSWNPMILEHSY